MQVDNGYAAQGRCPFSSGSSSVGRCPFTGATATPAPSNVASPHRSSSTITWASFQSAPVVPQLDERSAEAARTLADRGIPTPQISMLLNVDEAAVNAVVRGAEEAQVGRVLDSNLQQRLDELLTEDADLCCPINLMVLSDPVVASDGFIYEKASLEQLLRGGGVSPMTRQGLKTQFFPAKERKKKALEFREVRSKELLAFANEALVAGQPKMAGEAAERVLDYVTGLQRGSCPALESKLTELYLKLGRAAPDFQKLTQL